MCLEEEEAKGGDGGEEQAKLEMSYRLIFIWKLPGQASAHHNCKSRLGGINDFFSSFTKGNRSHDRRITQDGIKEDPKD